MKKYAVLLTAAVLAATVLTGCKGSSNGVHSSVRSKSDSLKVSCVTLTFTFKEIAESEEGGGALQEKVHMTMVQRVSLGSEFEIHDEKTVDYEEEIEGLTVPVSGVRMFSVNGNTKVLGDSGKFILNAEIRHIDEPRKVTFNGKPSVILAMHSDEETVITESGPIIITLKVSEPEEVTYFKK